MGSLRAEIDEQAVAHREEFSALTKRVDLLSKQIEDFRLQSESYNAMRTTVEHLRIALDALRNNSDPDSTSLVATVNQTPNSPHTSDSV